MKKCIFHYPGPISSKPSVGSELRPYKMLEAFKNSGYEVIEVTGSSAERTKKIREIKDNIKKGIKYDFLYAENRNIPTILADEDHIPRHPLADFSLFKICSDNDIPMGLFYRDCHWAFEELRKGTSKLKRLILDICIKAELRKYVKFFKKIYLPSEEMHKYVFQNRDIDVLPPGGNIVENLNAFKMHGTNDTLNVFYVGGIYGIYDITNIVKAVSQVENVNLTICTVKEQWDAYKGYYEPLMNERISIIHKKSDELKEYYKTAHFSLFLVNDNEYANMAMPIKVFEAINYGTPIVVSDNMAVAKIIKEEKCGWVIENSVDSLVGLLDYLKSNPEELSNKTQNTILAASKHSWQVRTKKVIEDLTI